MGQERDGRAAAEPLGQPHRPARARKARRGLPPLTSAPQLVITGRVRRSRFSFAYSWGFVTGSDGPERAELLIMARLLYMSIMSLDGYVADEAGSYDWAMPDDEVFGFVNDF